MIHLDTSFLIRALVRGSNEDALLRTWLTAGESLGMSTVAWTEFLCGPVGREASDLAKRVVGRRVGFSEEHAEVAAELFNESGRRKGTLIDCMIAAAALADNAAIATSNATDFRRLRPGGVRVLSSD
ncbi:MAG: PIN domain-containing protein [Gammaproteobacteria bacterium]|nr:PIN domain-containing protein [Gammaproteobacteria bacterium]MDH3506283.1 PIN domain-containing protein [Gammaproteobacteria bacterium]